MREVCVCVCAYIPGKAVDIQGLQQAEVRMRVVEPALGVAPCDRCLFESGAKVTTLTQAHVHREREKERERERERGKPADILTQRQTQTHTHSSRTCPPSNPSRP